MLAVNHNIFEIMEAAINVSQYHKVHKSKAIPITRCEGPQDHETSRLPYFLQSRLTGGGEVVSLTRLPPFTRRKILGTHFC
jgi:hypothetical protein